MTVRAPAKVNLHLGVGALRDDGYHSVITVLQAVSLYDDVTAAPGIVRGAERRPDRTGTGHVAVVTSEPFAVTVDVSGEGATAGPPDAAALARPAGSAAPAASPRGSGPADVSAVPTGADNLAARAARLLADRIGITDPVRLSLAKAIPVAAGMAGGSADAAAALVACDALWNTGLDRAELAELAARLGSDVPFPMAGGTALATGRGERLSPVLARGEYHWVFALADGGLSTPAVYAEFDREPGRAEPTPPDAVLAALRAGDAAELGRALANDLQPAALRLRPALRRVLDTGLDLGAVGAIVSGSGPTCAFLARDASDSVSLAASLAGMGVCRAVRRAHGPVAGARLVG